MLDKESKQSLKEALAAGEAAKRKALKEEFRHRCQQTSWHFDSCAKMPRPNMMGEGLGSSTPGFAHDKTTRWTTVGKEPEKESPPSPREIEKAELKRRQKELQAACREMMQTKIAAGKVLEGYRVFLIPWPKTKWEEIMKKAGGMPVGVDIAFSEFGNLLLVPVQELGLKPTKNDPERPVMLDREGRAFWIQRDEREKLNRIFGFVKWTQPLTSADMKQFGVKFQ